jgi:hypothetical protein
MLMIRVTWQTHTFQKSILHLQCFFARVRLSISHMDIVCIAQLVSGSSQPITYPAGFQHRMILVSKLTA